VQFPSGTRLPLPNVRPSVNGLNLPRLKAKDSCFIAPSNPGSSTSFKPTSRRLLSLTRHCDLDGSENRNYSDTLLYSMWSHFFFYTWNTASCLESTSQLPENVSPILHICTWAFAKILSSLHHWWLELATSALKSEALWLLNSPLQSCRGSWQAVSRPYAASLSSDFLSAHVVYLARF